jgi:K+-sensing histidine kinase KdpD
LIQLIGLSSQAPLDGSTNHALEERLLDMIDDADTYREAIARVVEEGDVQEIEFQVHGPDADSSRQAGESMPEKREIRMRLFRVRDAQGQVIGRGKIFHDVTKHNEAERVKKNLLAIVSHELRTPLTAIKGYATSLLATDVEIEHTVQERFLRSIVEEDDRMADLVTNLLEMSQVEAGTLRLRPELYQAHVLLEQVIRAEKREHIRVQIADSMPLLYVDRRRMEMVMRNLLDNAWYYAGPDATVEIVLRHDEQGLHMSITDNGPGLPPHLTERIFDHFYQVDSGRKRRRGGVGLGLAICRGFVEAHEGRIWAENRTDGLTGARFCIWLPPGVFYTPTQQKSHLFDLPHAL